LKTIFLSAKMPKSLPLFARKGAKYSQYSIQRDNCNSSHSLRYFFKLVEDRFIDEYPFCVDMAYQDGLESVPISFVHVSAMIQEAGK
jgi:hypothetical protein